MPRYEEVNWDKAACAGAPTEMFYKIEENRKILEWIDIEVFRRLCMGCPIWQTCLSYGMENETYGVWGGLITHERNALKRNDQTNLKYKTIADMKKYGISMEQIQEVINEYKDYERSVENQSSY